MYRGNTDAEASVGISIDEATVEEGVFTLKSSNIAFAKGEAVGYAELVFGSIDDLSATGKYEIVLPRSFYCLMMFKLQQLLTSL